MDTSRNMTEGSEAGHIVRFALPLLGGNLLQQTYNIVDTVIVGTFLGDSALAAVGATGSITYLFYTLCIGLSIGAGVIIAQLFGMGDHKRMKSAIFSSNRMDGPAVPDARGKLGTVHRLRALEHPEPLWPARHDRRLGGHAARRAPHRPLP